MSEEPDDGLSPRHLARLEASAGVDGLVDALATRLSPTDLRSLLLEVLRRRADARDPAQVLRDFQNDAYVRVAPVDPRRLARFELAMWEQLGPEVAALTLSPVTPLGTTAALTGTSQNRVLSTARLGEVVSDSTNVLALEAARRRKRGGPDVHLAASHRVLRHQRYPAPSFSQHFHLFAQVHAGRVRADLGFEVAALRAQLGAFVRGVRSFLGREVPVRIELADLSGGARADLLEAGVLAPLRAELGSLDAALDTNRTRAAGYYRDVAYLLFAQDPAGAWLELADGGGVDWTAQLLSNRKERCLIGGLGSDRAVTLTSAPAGDAAG